MMMKPKPSPPPTPTSNLAAIPASFFGMHLGDINNANSGNANSAPWPTNLTFWGFRNWDVFVYYPTHPLHATLGDYVGPIWEQTHYASGQFDWYMFDQFFSAMNTHAVKDIIFNLGSAPAFINGGSNPKTVPPNSGNYTHWDAWVTAAVARARDTHGRTGVYWEIWNEPNASNFYTGTMQTLAILTKRATPILKAADPKARVISPAVTGNDPTYFTDYFTADISGGKTADYVDIIGWHLYYASVSNTGGGEFLPEDHVGSGNAYQRIPDVLKTLGISGKELWMTEGSTAVNHGNYTNNGAALCRAMLLNWSYGAKRHYYYAYDYDNFGKLSVAVAPYTALNAAGEAYKQTRLWMMGAVMTSPVTNASGVWSCLLARTGYEGKVIWRPAGNASHTPLTKYTRYRDLAGNVTAISPVGTAVTIGVSPIILETGAPP